MASASDSTNTSGIHARTSTYEVVFDLESEVREARYLSDALVALAENFSSSREAVLFLAFETQKRLKRVESAWEQAFEASRAH